MVYRRFTALLFVLFLTTGSAPVWGMEGGYAYASTRQGSTNFSLHLSRQVTTLDYASKAYRTTTREIGIDWAEALLPQIDGVLTAGYLDIDQPDNPALAGLSPSGHYAGVGLRATLLQTRRFSTSLGVHYRYHQVNAATPSQDIEIHWEDSGIEFAATLQPVPRLSLTGGVDYGQITGEQQQRGTINLTRHFEQSRQLGYFAVISLHVARGGAIRLAVQRGRYQGGWLSFSRAF